MSTETSYAIVPATPGQLDKILDLLGSCNLPSDGLADHVSTCLVACCGDDIAGSVALELYGRSALLRSLAVEEQTQGRGIGKSLTGAALALAASRDVADIYLLTETAPEFFRNIGFEPVSRLDVPEAVRTSVEFTTACPDTAQVMHLALSTIGQ